MYLNVWTFGQQQGIKLDLFNAAKTLDTNTNFRRKKSQVSQFFFIHPCIDWSLVGKVSVLEFKGDEPHNSRYKTALI